MYSGISLYELIQEQKGNISYLCVFETDDSIIIKFICLLFLEN